MRPKNELISYQLLDASYLASISHLFSNPEWIEFLSVDDRKIRIGKNELAYTLQDFIIARQIDQNLFKMLQNHFPDTLKESPVFPKKLSDNLFEFLSESRRMHVVECIKEIDATNSPNVEQLFGKAQMLIYSGQYSDGQKLLLSLKQQENINDELKKQIENHLVLVEKTVTPFKALCEEIPLADSFFQSGKTIHKNESAHIIGALKFEFVPKGDIYAGVISFPQGGEELISISPDMQQKIVQCLSIQDLIRIFRMDADETLNNMAAILEAYDSTDAIHFPYN